MGKIVRFSLSNSPVKYSGFKDKYNYGTNIHNLIYKDGHFENVRFQASNITKCNFKNAKLKGIDFMNTNLKNTSFKGAILQDIVFFNCNLKGTDFKNATFKNVKFISTNVKNSIDLNISDGINVMNEYPNIQLNSDLEQSIFRLASLSKIYKYHVLHVKKNKINLWSILLLLEFYKQEDLSRALAALARRNDKRGFYTIYKYRKFIDAYLKI
jgi:hypothetical protein